MATKLKVSQVMQTELPGVCCMVIQQVFFGHLQIVCVVQFFAAPTPTTFWAATDTCTLPKLERFGMKRWLHLPFTHPAMVTIIVSTKDSVWNLIWYWVMSPDTFGHGSIGSWREAMWCKKHSHKAIHMQMHALFFPEIMSGMILIHATVNPFNCSKTCTQQ